MANIDPDDKNFLIELRHAHRPLQEFELPTLRTYYAILKQFSPTCAAVPQLAAAWLHSVMRQGMVTVAEVRHLLETELLYAQLLATRKHVVDA